MNIYTDKKIRTNRLFPRTGFLTGMGSVLNISGRYFDFNYSKSASDVDTEAIASDWNMVGKDIQQVLDEKPLKSIIKLNDRKVAK